MEVSIRPYAPTDAAATRSVFESAIRGTASAYYTPEQIDAWSPRSYDATAWHRSRSRAWTLVAESAGEVVAFADLTEDGVVDMLFVAPHAGRRGVARLLVGGVLAEARRRGHTRVTTRASRAAEPAFERFGFVVDRVNDDNTVRGVVVPNAEALQPHDHPRHLRPRVLGPGRTVRERRAGCRFP